MSEFRVAVVGVSAGGLGALETLVGGLPDTFRLPLLIAQHRDRRSDRLLRMLLQQRTPLPLAEAEDKEKIVGGHVYLAPAGYHLLVDDGHLALSVDPRVSGARPSIDVLFESAARAYSPAVIGVVLTGANHDGAAGLKAVARRGGLAVVQDPATAKRPEMPRAAIEASGTKHVLPLAEVAPFIARRCERRTRKKRSARTIHRPSV